jgi:DNA polymerase IV
VRGQAGSGRVASAGEVVAGGGPLGGDDLAGLRILHADMDAFYASIEVRRDPSLAGKPLLVAGTGPRGVVTSASYEARAYGCRSAMPTQRARRMCPQALVIPPDFAAYQQVSRQVMATFRAVTPLVEPLSLDEAFLDVGGAERLAGSALAIARDLRVRVREQTGLVVTVGVAANKFLAKLASTRGKPDGLLVVPPSQTLGFLHPLPVQVLWGVGEATLAVLHRYGLATVGELARAPRATLERALGQSNGARLHELAWGRDERPVVSDEEPKSVSSEETFETDLDDPDTLAKEVRRCAVRVGRRLRAACLSGRTVTLKVRFADFKTVTRSRTLPSSLDGDAELGRIGTELLAALGVSRPVRLVGMGVSGLVAEGAPVQLELGVEDAAGRRAVDAVADRIRDRWGERSLELASLVDEPETAFAEARDEPRARRDLRTDP